MYLLNDTILQGGKYKIVRHISSGGFGNTYEGLHTMMETRVAIKEFFPKMFCNRDDNTLNVSVATHSNRELVEKLRKKFIAEAKAIYKMQHNSIVRVLDVFEENGTAYYVMDYVDGQSLHEIVNERGALPEQEVLEYVEQIADALEYVHSQNRLHLDIKPGNILVNKLGKVKLIDFGASKQYDEVDGENTSTLLGKTPGYAPIEQMGNSVQTFTPATDIYALGATMYKCLTGNTPPDSVLIASGEDIKPLPSSLNVNTCNAVLRAMQVSKTKRPQRIDEFMALLKPSAGIASMGTVDAVEEDTFFDVNSNAKVRVVTESTNTNDILFDIEGVRFKMIKVTGGKFEMRETVRRGFLGLSSKEIVQPTNLSDYYIGETQVTQALWKVVMGINPSHFKGDNLPVESVSWNGCQYFISKLNSLTGQNFRLPTEAEWEFAARGGNNGSSYQYSGNDTIEVVAWYNGNSGNKTHSVASKQPNELGIYDMIGNVWEWCLDWYGGYNSSPQNNPIGIGSGDSRVRRGGSWYTYARYCCSSYRGYDSPGAYYQDLGLRLALVL